MIYLRDPKADKDELARGVAAECGVKRGPVCAIRALEPSLTFEHRGTHIIRRIRPCGVLYQYQIHPEGGWMYNRSQTWFPFNLQVGRNGRTEWLARPMDQAGLKYRKQGNCFVWIEDYSQAQKLLNRQLEMNRAELLNGFAGQLNPAHEDIFAHYPAGYYWTAYRTEWATDIVFRAADFLKRLMPLLVRHGMWSFLQPRPDALLRPEGQPVGSDPGPLQRDAGNRSQTPPGRGARQIPPEWQLGEVLTPRRTASAVACCGARKPPSTQSRTSAPTGRRKEDRPKICSGGPCAKGSPIYIAGLKYRKKPISDY